MVVGPFLNFSTTLIDPWTKSVSSFENGNKKEIAVAPTESSGGVVVSSVSGVVEPVGLEFIEP